jgi:hypothetical protein
VSDTSSEAVERVALTCDSWKRAAYGGGLEWAGTAAATLRALSAERDAAHALLREAADDLRASVNAEYEGTEAYPAMARKKERDLDLVRRIEAVLEIAQ